MPQGGDCDWRWFGYRINAYRTVRQLRGDLEVAMAGVPARSEPGVIQLTLNRRIWRSPGTARIAFSRWNLDSVWCYPALGKYAGELKVVQHESAT